jgi:hypothetical protein
MRLWLVLVILSLAVDASEQWKEKVLYSFQGGSDGTYPAGGAVFDQAGSLYGATGLTCRSANYSQVAVLLDSSNNSLEDVRLMGFDDGTRIGSLATAQSNVSSSPEVDPI